MFKLFTQSAFNGNLELANPVLSRPSSRTFLVQLLTHFQYCQGMIFKYFFTLILISYMYNCDVTSTPFRSATWARSKTAGKTRSSSCTSPLTCTTSCSSCSRTRCGPPSNTPEKMRSICRRLKVKHIHPCRYLGTCRCYRMLN